MKERSSDIILQLNRLVNDRTLTPQVRAKIKEAIRHINELHDGVAQIRNLYLKLNKAKSMQIEGRREVS